MPTRAMRLKTQARVLACLQAICLTLSVVKEQSLFASLMRLEKELFPLYLRQGECRNAARGYDCGCFPATPQTRYRTAAGTAANARTGTRTPPPPART